MSIGEFGGVMFLAVTGLAVVALLISALPGDVTR